MELTANDVKQRWTVDGAVVWSGSNPCELLDVNERGVGFVVSIGHEVAAHVVEGAGLVVDLVGPGGELCWLAGTLENVVIASDRVTARVRAPGL